MSATVAAAVKAAIVILSNEEARKKVGWGIVAILSPLIVLVVLLCAILSGTSQHNVSAVELCFHGGSISASATPEYQRYIEDMRNSFDQLDEVIAEINSQCEDGKSLDDTRVKAIFYALYFAAEQPDTDGIHEFADCFVDYEERTRTVTTTDEEGNEVETTETYMVAVPIEDLAEIYERISHAIGVEVTADHQANADSIYHLILYGSPSGESGGWFPGADVPFIGVDGFCSPIGAGWESVVTSEFGYRSDPFTGETRGHTGIDLAVPTGTPIRAALPGTVTVSQYNSSYGYYVIIDHGNGLEDGNGFDTMLLEKLEQRPEAADVTLTDECFDVCYYLDYCKNLAPEQPAPSLSAERKEEIISGILNYMAEYFDDSSLYDILHNTLEICNDEIGCLGFALYDEYVDEQIEASEVQSDLLPKSGRLVNLLSAYEELQQIPDEERITRLAPGAFGYCLDPNVPDERLHTAYQQALSALELESDEIQEAESFTSRDEIISRMRDCLLAKELTAGDKVLFVATEPYGGPGDFDLRGGVIESVDEKDKTCSVRGTFFTMEKVPLHYVLGRYNPAVGEEHYGVRGIVPFFCEDKELAGYYLNEVRTMWDVEMGEEQDLSM